MTPPLRTTDRPAGVPDVVNQPFAQMREDLTNPRLRRALEKAQKMRSEDGVADRNARFNSSI